MKKKEKAIINSLDVSKKQKAITLELRSAIDAVHVTNNNLRQKYSFLVKELYDKFNEGFNCLDLLEAKHIIDNGEFY